MASLILSPVLTFAGPPRGVDCEAAELLPRSIVACAEVSDLGAVLHTVMNHPLRAQLDAIPAYDVFMQSGAAGRLQMALRAFEASMGKPWQQALDTLTDRGVTLALDASDGGAAILIHSSDAELLERFRGFVLALRQMQGATAKQGDYRGFVADMVSDQLKMVRMHDWMLLTNNAELGKTIIDQYLDRNGETLVSNTAYVAALRDFDAGEAKHCVAVAFLDVKTLRDAGVANKFNKEKTDNLAGEVALGGVLANIRHTPYLTGQLHLSNDGLSLRLASPHQRDWEPPREYFFGEPELAAAPSLLNVPNRLFALSTHRDLSQMWLRAGDLVSDRATDQLAVADTTLTTFFSGRDFGEDILGSFASDVQIVGMEQDFSDVLPQPAIKLPAFAMQFRMKNPEETQPELRRVFQSFIGFLNVVGAQNGQPQLDLGMESIGDTQLITASYVPDRDKRESLDAKIQFNFSPTMAFADERIILSSSLALAREMTKTDSTIEAAADAGDSNTNGQLDATTLRRILDTNRSQLVANNMIEKGHSKEAAEGEIGLLLELLGFFRGLRLNLDVAESQMSLNLAVDLLTEAGTQQ
ncbi:hypothetical protein [Allorhodopirellula heiligendammensis]|uniref:Uncharacterized protein n=1 Tax=Allorhodopirellula heiligendammensis TaxID=2714739 RepID=A0A5C6BUP1_9BACT|nr:hypothetical protein [Allorhodopirellula heiligendammensis]TWU15990.1 hypothetical protein Poly21_31940 [Allorhodopirellula heiligendammensis]